MCLNYDFCQSENSVIVPFYRYNEKLFFSGNVVWCKVHLEPNFSCKVPVFFTVPLPIFNISNVTVLALNERCTYQDKNTKTSNDKTNGVGRRIDAACYWLQRKLHPFSNFFVPLDIFITFGYRSAMGKTQLGPAKFGQTVGKSRPGLITLR